MANHRSLLSDGIVSLRALELSDLDLLYTLENDTSLWRDGVTNSPLSRSLLERYILTSSADVFTDGQLRLTIVDVDTGKPIGFVDLFEFDHINRRAGIGIVITASYRGKGFGLHAVNLISEYSANRLGLHQIWAITTSDNIASRTLFAAAGFHTCGSLRSWIRKTANTYADALIWQRLF